MPTAFLREWGLCCWNLDLGNEAVLAVCYRSTSSRGCDCLCGLRRARLRAALADSVAEVLAGESVTAEVRSTSIPRFRTSVPS